MATDPRDELKYTWLSTFAEKNYPKPSAFLRWWRSTLTLERQETLREQDRKSFYSLLLEKYNELEWHMVEALTIAEKNLNNSASTMDEQALNQAIAESQIHLREKIKVQFQQMLVANYNPKKTKRFNLDQLTTQLTELQQQLAPICQQELVKAAQEWKQAKALLAAHLDEPGYKVSRQDYPALLNHSFVVGPDRVIYKLEHKASLNPRDKGYLAQKNEHLYHPSDVDEANNPTEEKMKFVTICRVKFGTSEDGHKIIYKTQLVKAADGYQDQAFKAGVAPTPAIYREGSGEYDYKEVFSQKQFSDYKRTEFLTYYGDDLASAFGEKSTIVFSGQDILDIMLQCMTIVNDLHLGKLGDLPPSFHRDIKLENFTLSKNPDGTWKVTLIDFDETRPIDTNGQVIAAPIGTFPYVAPEIEPAIKSSADSMTTTVGTEVYALGITLEKICEAKGHLLSETNRTELTQLSEKMTRHGIYRSPMKMRV